MLIPATERLALALAVSAGAHIALLAGAPFAPGPGALSLVAARPLTARIVSPVARLEPELALAPAEALQPQPRIHEPKAEPQANAPAATRVAAVSPAPASGLPSAEIYYRSSELDERATPLNEVTLVYPEPALVARQRGTVTLRLKIDHQGTLRDAEVLDAEPAGVFEEAALKAARELRFRPAMRHGVAVGSLKTIEVPFVPDCGRTGTCISGAPGAMARR